MANLAVKDSTPEDKNDVQKIWKLVTSELSVDLENGRINELDVLFAPEDIELRLALPEAKVPEFSLFYDILRYLKSC